MDLRLKTMENENKVLRERFNGGEGKLKETRFEANEKIEQYLRQIAELEAKKFELKKEVENVKDEKEKLDLKHKSDF